MTEVRFALDVECACSATVLWNALVDWPSHGDWIPATRSRILEGDGGLHTVFEAVTGYGPLRLVDRMRVVTFDPVALAAEVEKIGPQLHGRAGFTVTAVGAGCRVHWFESVQVPWLPRWLAPLACAAGRVSFRASLHRLTSRLA